MRMAISKQIRMMATLAVVPASVSFGVFPAGAADASTDVRSVTVELAYGCSVFGPYATIRRATEEIDYARSNGYNAIYFHNGDGYYVRVC